MTCLNAPTITPPQVPSKLSIMSNCALAYGIFVTRIPLHNTERHHSYRPIKGVKGAKP